jgi:HlyD family secretion protein
MNITNRAAFYAVASLACAATLGAAAGCAKQNDGAASASAPQALPVTAQAVRVGTLTSTFALTGTIVPQQQANLASVISGTVQSVTVQIGDHVSAGQLLVQIDDSTLRAQLAQDQASLVEAQARARQTYATNRGTASTTSSSLQSAQVTYDAAVADNRRNEVLFRQGFISQQAIEKSRSDLAAARSALDSALVAAQNANMSTDQSSAAQADVASMQAAVTVDQAAVQAVETQIAQAAVRAPFDGIVTQRNVDPGSLASPGAPLVQVSQLNPAYVNVGVPDGDLQYVRAGSEAGVHVDALAGHTWHGKVDHLNAAAGEGTLTYLARISLPNPDLTLKAGMVANVTFVSARNSGILIVPRGAIATTDAGSAVYVVDNGKAKLRQVVVGLQTQNDAQISGAAIAKGTLVITQRPDALQDGSPVKVVASN